jgi:site-specific DNA recombinase
MPERGLIYARLSPRDGDADADLARMVRELEGFASRQHVSVADVIAERDVSAWNNGKARKGRWPEVVEGLRTGRWDALVVRSLDRCARDMIETIKLAQLCTQVGFGFYAMNGDRLGDELVAAIDGWKNARESKDKSDRIKLAHAAKAANGDYQPGRYRPFGYQLVRNTSGIITSLRVDPREAEIVREIADRIIAGESLHTIALDMERRGVPTVSGAQWHRATVKRVVKAACAGLRENHGNGLPGNWPAIIDIDTYLAAKAAMRYGETPPKGFNTRRHLLTGFVMCGICGVGLACNGTRYQCGTRQTRNGVRGCGGVSRKLEYLEGLITDLVVAHLEQLHLEAEQVVTDDWAPVIEVTKAELAFIHAAYEAGEIPAGDWVKGVKAAHKKLAEAEAGRADALAAATGQATRQAAGEAAREKWDGLNLSQRRAILSELFEAIVVKRAGRGNGFKFRDDLIVPVWRNSR